MKNFYNEMNDLQKFIYESDLPAVAKTDQAFWRQITENTAAAIKEGTLGIAVGCGDTLHPLFCTSFVLCNCD